VALECVVVRMVPPGASLRLMAVQSFVAVVPSEQPGAVECERDRDQNLNEGGSAGTRRTHQRNRAKAGLIKAAKQHFGRKQIDTQ
jgi:hypothetical protein